MNGAFEKCEMCNDVLPYNNHHSINIEIGQVCRVTIIITNFLGQSCRVAYFLLQGDLMSAITCGLSALMLALFFKKDIWKWTTSPGVITLFILIF